MRARLAAMAAAAAGEAGRPLAGEAPGKDAARAGDSRASGGPRLRVEAQHLTPTIIDRVNAHLGWRCVARIALRQEAIIPATASRPSLARAPKPDAAARARAIEAAEGVAEEGLRDALIRLGERALAGPSGAAGDA